MSRGGARNQSGPAPDPRSERSERRGIRLDALPVEGYAGEPPTFPLPDQTDREREVWAWAWSTPQAFAWAKQPWRHRTIAMWVRWSVRMEEPDAGAALGNVVVRLADQIGMTPAGLKENGWRITIDEVAAKREMIAQPVDEDDEDDVRGRFAVVRDAAG